MHVPVDRQTCHVIPDTNRTTRLMWLGVIIVALFMLLSTQATAASFDCKKASIWVEKTVCSNPELSKLDEQMAKEYANTLADLSLDGQKETKQYQKQWLKKIFHIKTKLDKYYSKNKEYPASDRDQDIISDLQYYYKDRIGQLQQSVIEFADRILRNVYINHSGIDKSCIEDEIRTYSSDDEFVVREFSYPQIMKPLNDYDKIINKYVSQKAHDQFKKDESQECTDIYDKFSINFINKHVISFQGALLWHEHGSPKAYTNVISFSWLFEAKRELKASDLFDNKTEWQKKLMTLTSQELKEQESDDKNIYELTPSELKKIVTSSKQWVITKDGLGIQFYLTDFHRLTGPILITIGWKDLNPYLSKNGRLLIYD